MKISRLTPDSWYLQTVALNCRKITGDDYCKSKRRLLLNGAIIQRCFNGNWFRGLPLSPPPPHLKKWWTKNTSQHRDNLNCSPQDSLNVKMRGITFSKTIMVVRYRIVDILAICIFQSFLFQNQHHCCLKTSFHLQKEYSISFNLIPGFWHLQFKVGALHRLYARHLWRYTVILTWNPC